MFHHSKDESSDFLPTLTQAFKSIDVNNAIVTKEFVDACAHVEPIFDHIGTLYFLIPNFVVAIITLHVASVVVFVLLSCVCFENGMSNQ